MANLFRGIVDKLEQAQWYISASDVKKALGESSGYDFVKMMDAGSFNNTFTFLMKDIAPVISTAEVNGSTFYRIDDNGDIRFICNMFVGALDENKRTIHEVLTHARQVYRNSDECMQCLAMTTEKAEGYLKYLAILGRCERIGGGLFMKKREPVNPYPLVHVTQPRKIGAYCPLAMAVS